MDHYECQYRSYANEFWHQLTGTLWTEQESLEYLPIVFVNDAGQNIRETTHGVTHYHTNTCTGIATIYPVIYLQNLHSDTEIKRTIRHEAIHYFLGIQYRCHDDDSALFWLVCDLFDGGAYLPLDDSKDAIFKTAIPFLHEALQLYTETQSTSVACNLSLMLTAIDDAEFSNSANLNKLTQQLNVCLEAAKLSVRKP